MKSDAYMTVTCNGCGAEEQVELTALAARGSYDKRNVDGHLKSVDWTTDGDEDYCADCSEAREKSK